MVGRGDRGDAGAVPRPARRRCDGGASWSSCPRSRCRTGCSACSCSDRSPGSRVLAGLYDGLRLATIVICVGAANSLANPKRLLRSVPAALHEVGAALVVAVTVLPQLADSARRVRAAQALRAGTPAVPGGCAGSWCRCWRTPSSGRCGWPPGWTPGATAARAARPPARATDHRCADAVGLCGVCVGVYAGLDHTAPAGAGHADAGRWAWPPRSSDWSGAGRRVGRSRYRPDPWRVAGVRGDAHRDRDRGRRLVGGRTPARSVAYPRPDDVPGGQPLALARRRRRLRSRWPRPLARRATGWSRQVTRLIELRGIGFGYADGRSSPAST